MTFRLSEVRFTESLHGLNTAHRVYEPKAGATHASASWTAVTQCNEVTALAPAAAPEFVLPIAPAQAATSQTPSPQSKTGRQGPRFMAENSFLNLVFGIWCLVFGVGLFPGAVSGPAADTNAVLNAWLSAQTNLRTWKADFTQTRMLKALTQPLVATGRVWFAVPNRFRWELGSPAQTIALRQFDQMFVVYPLLKRAERYALGGTGAGQWREALALLEAGFPRDRAELNARFHVLSLTETNASWQLALQPTSAFARRMMPVIRVRLATNDFSLTATELVFTDGSRMRNDFTNATLNAPFDDMVFDWKPGPEFKVTEPLGK